jgi:pimeloyl-ACP methyl ester carboxylesterase
VTTWLLLRGLTRETRHWGDFPQVLQARLPDADIHAIDLPGCGNLNEIRCPASIEAIAHQCRDQALARRLQPPFHLVAISLGGMVAVAWAQAHPTEIAKGVLINTSLRPFSSVRQRLRPAACRSLLSFLLPIGARHREEVVLALTSARADELHAVLDAWTVWRQERSVSLANAMRQLTAAMRYVAPLVAPARFLVLAAGRDLLVDPECSRSLARAWQADFAEHPTAGHDLPLDDGAWVAQQIARWCATEPYHHG